MNAALFHNFDTEGLKEVVECLESLEIFIDKDAQLMKALKVRRVLKVLRAIIVLKVVTAMNICMCSKKVLRIFKILYVVTADHLPLQLSHSLTPV